MKGNAITIVVVVSSSVISYLLVQPAGTFPPSVVLLIGAVNIALTTLSRFLPSQGQPIPVEVTSPVPVTPAEPDKP